MSASGDPPFPCRPPCLPRRLISERSFHKIPKSGNLKKQPPTPPHSLHTKVVPPRRSTLGVGVGVLAVVRRLSRVGAALPAPLPGVETGGDAAAPARPEPAPARATCAPSPSRGPESARSNWQTEKTPVRATTAEKITRHSQTVRVSHLHWT